LGADVTGIDFHSHNIEIARRRGEYYSNLAGNALRLRWIRGNVLRDVDEKYDVVWAREAITHIFPVEGFLDVVTGVLEPGGFFIVSDVSRWHPGWVLLDAWERGLFRRRYSVMPDKASGDEVLYGDENAVSVRWLKRQLRGRGFDIVRVRHSTFFVDAVMPGWAFPYAKRLERVLASSPVTDWLGMVYTLTAQKAG